MTSPKTRRENPRLEADQVAAYLADHPDFFADHPALLPSHAPEGGVIDFHRHALRRLQQNLDGVTQEAAEVIHTARSNHSTQGRVHAAVLAVLSADSPQSLARTLAEDLPRLLDVDLVVLAVERAVPWVVAGQTLVSVPVGTVGRLLGSSPLALRAVGNPEAEAMLYGSGAALVTTEALIRLPPSRLPPAVLALGSRNPAAFDAGQSTELLSFLAAIIALWCQPWLA